MVEIIHKTTYKSFNNNNNEYCVNYSAHYDKKAKTLLKNTSHCDKIMNNML